MRFGLTRLAALARQPWIGMPMLNPVGPILARNAAAESFTRSETSLLRNFDPRRDRLNIGAARCRRFDFRPQFVEAMDGFKFVHLSPK